MNAEEELSHLGTGHGFLRAPQVEFTGKIRKVVGGKVILVDDPVYLNKQANRRAAVSRAKQILLLTDDQSEALFGKG